MEGATSETLTGFGCTAPSRATVYDPRERDTIRDLVTSELPRGLIARGLGRAYGDAAQNAGGAVARLTAMRKIRAFDVESGRVTVDAGISLGDLLSVAVQLGWFAPVIPGTRFVTVGGAIASDIHGKYRHGSFAEQVESFELVTPDGTTRTVRPGTDEFTATAGGMGLTGVISAATLRLRPVESAYLTVTTERANDVDDCMARMLNHDDRFDYSVAWIDCIATGAAMGRSILTRGSHAPIAALDRRAAARAPNTMRPPRSLPAPPWVPNGLLNSWSMRAFNELWFRKESRQAKETVQHFESFFWPLDIIDGFNRIYGSQGFVQYQFVVPYDRDDVVRAALERITTTGCPSFLAVLKRFTHASPGLLGFPMPGWTLALDIPTRSHGLAPLLDGLDILVTEAGGRVYLAKDSRLDPQFMARMYPNLDRWREIRSRLDPDATMQSDLARRLRLT